MPDSPKPPRKKRSPRAARRPMKPAEGAPMPGTAKKRLRRAMTLTRAAVPRYTREIIASVRERRRAHAAITPSEAIDRFIHEDLAALWIGHATVLLRIGGTTILTDPVFSRRIGMCVGGVTIGLARLCPPAVDIAHLPPIDLVLLSHAHFDHLDRPSLLRLASGPAKGAQVVTASHTARLIPRGFGDVVELPWRRSARIRGVTISAIQPEHWGARTAVDRHRRFNSYLLEASHHRVLFAGDTAHTHAFDKVGPVDLAVFGIGAYDPWEEAHATPEQVWSMYTRLAGPPHTPRGSLLPMHHSTFTLGREPIDEPIRRLRQIAGPHATHIVADMPGTMWAHQ